MRCITLVFSVLAWVCLSWTTAPVNAATYTLLLSASPDRTGPVALEGLTVAGTVYVFTAPDAGVTRARFFLDDPGMTKKPRQTENSAPFDFAGGSVALANPFDTTKFPDGSHTITAALELAGGGTAIVNASFIVANSAPALAWSPDPVTLTVVEGGSTTASVNLNAVGGTADFTVSGDAGWLTAVPGSGSTPASIVLTGDAAGLTPGTYTAMVTAQAPGYLSDSLTVALQVVASSSPPSWGQTHISIHGDAFYINGAMTYRESPAQGLLMNVRMVNAVFEDPVKRPDFDPDANTDEFLAAMPGYVSHGVLAFSVCLQGGNPGYENAVNTAFNPDGSLKPAYLDRAARVIRQADALGAVIILGLYYQRQDQRLADENALRAGVVNVMRWVAEEGFTNVLIEIANEYRHSGYDHPLIRSHSGIASLITLARSVAPHIAVSASGLGDGTLASEVAGAADYLLIHANGISDSTMVNRINALKSYGKPIVIAEDPVTPGARRVGLAVQHGASWGLHWKGNQVYPFTFNGAPDDPETYAEIRRLTR